MNVLYELVGIFVLVCAVKCDHIADQTKCPSDCSDEGTKRKLCVQVFKTKEVSLVLKTLSVN